MSHKVSSSIIQDIPDVMTRRQASTYLQVGISTLDTKLNIPFIKMGKSVRYLKSDLDAFLLKNRIAGGAE